MKKNISRCLSLIKQSGWGKDSGGLNVIAFSGGVDSSVAAALVYTCFPENSFAVVGVSPSLSTVHLENAISVAEHIGIPQLTIPTDEYTVPGYIENKGQSCYHCKTSLYKSLSRVTVSRHQIHEALRKSRAYAYAYEPNRTQVKIFNGTNYDDLGDPTRLGLIAANEYDVCSPLERLTKVEVREMAKHLGLPNHATAAGPCLRSRLALGVQASVEHLRFIEQAEAVVRTALNLRDNENMRVRMLLKRNYRIEVDQNRLAEAQSIVEEVFHKAKFPTDSKLTVKAFRSGSVST